MSKIAATAPHNFNELFESGVEEALQQSVFDFFPGIIYVYDANQKKLRYVNKGISEVLGYTYDDLNEWDHDLNKLIFKEDIETVQKELEKYNDLKDEESHSYHCRLNHKQGDWVHFQVTGKIIKRNDQGRPSSLLFIAKDTSQQMKAAEELKAINLQIKEQEELLLDYKERVDIKEEILECGSWKITMGDDRITWSDGMYPIFGYDAKLDKASLVINEDLYSRHMTGSTFKKAQQFRDDVLKDANDYHREYPIITNKGEKRIIETFAKIIRDKSGAAIRVLGTTQNVTVARNSEKEKERHIDQLNNSVTNLADFTYIASHDIQEPLRKIATFSARMKEKFANDLNDEARSYLDRILNTSRSAHLLIDGLMGFLQLDHQQQRFKKTDLNVLLEEVKVELELRLEETQATIIAKPLPVLEVNALQIKQLMVNLLLNAFKFRKPESLLVIEIDSKKLTTEEVKKEHLEEGSEYVRISIQDNGVGFVEAPSGKMFQMFQRFHNKADYPGAGIGLAICKKIIDKHNGLISAWSEPGKGATFSFVLPVKQSLTHVAP